LYARIQSKTHFVNRFDEDFIANIANHLISKKSKGADAKRYEATLLQQSWLCAVPTNPPIVMLDIRTKRVNDRPNDPARLMNQNALREFTNEWNMVSPTPVYGFKAIEFLQHKALGTHLVSVETLDYESWSGNPKGLELFEQTLIDNISPSWCVFISGDVHYSFVKKLKVTRNRKSFEVVQLTSSPLMNAPSSKYAFRRLTSTAYTEKARKITILFLKKRNTMCWIEIISQYSIWIMRMRSLKQ